MEIRRAVIAQDDNRLMAEDAKTSKALTALGLVFIPASFAAVRDLSIYPGDCVMGHKV